MDMMVGNRRAPEATILGGRARVPHLPTITFVSRRRVLYFVMDNPVDSVTTASAFDRSFASWWIRAQRNVLLTFRWMLWLAPAGLRGGFELEACRQSRQPQSFFLCGPRCSGTSDRCSGRCGVIFLRAVRGSRIFVHVVAALSAWCRGTSQRNIAF